MNNEKNYCISKDCDAIYALSYEQLQEMYECLGNFMQKEKKSLEPIADVNDKDEDLKIKIQKSIEFDGNTTCFKSFYDVSMLEGDLTYLSFKQVKQLSDMLLVFLTKYGDQEDIVGNFCEEPETGSENNDSVRIIEDREITGRLSVFRSNVLIAKYITQFLGEPHPKVSYSLYSNERILGDLTTAELRNLHRNLSILLKSKEMDEV